MSGDMKERRVSESERCALVRIAQTRMAQFIACENDHVTALATLAEAALHDAIAAGVDVDQLAAELDLSPQALAAILRHAPGLLDLHPTSVRTAP